MATQKQRRTWKEMVGNGGNITRAMIKAGYSLKTAHTPSKFTHSKAFQGFEVVCSENGLSAELIIKSLVEDIRSKPTERVSELLLASKLLGLLDKAKQERMDQDLEDAEKYGIQVVLSDEEKNTIEKALRDI